MEENVTEETDVERMAKGERTKTLDILSCILLFLTIFPLGSGFLLPYIFQTKNDNVRIPDYIWLSSAAFHVISTAIWTGFTISAFQDKDSTRESTGAVWLGLIFLGLCLTLSVFLLIWFCRDR
jgi:hypothetical protein